MRRQGEQGKEEVPRSSLLPSHPSASLPTPFLCVLPVFLSQVKALHQVADSMRHELRTEALGQLKDVAQFFVRQIKSERVANAEVGVGGRTREGKGERWEKWKG